jgi:MFS family permease
VTAGRRDLTLLAAGQAVSVAGDSAAMVALLLRLRPEGSGWVAALLAAELVPFVVCAPLSGRIVDHVETRRVLLIALLGQAVIAVPLAVFALPGITVALFAVLNALSTLVRPATSTLVPAAVGPAHAAHGYARLATGAGIGFIAGPVLGGLVTGVTGSTTTLLIDAATFLILSGFVSLVRVRRPPATAAEPRNARAMAGFALLWRSRVLRAALVISAIATGCAVVDNVAAPFRFINQLGTNDLGYGLYLAVWGAGSLLGVQVLPRVTARRHPAALAAGNLLMGLGIAAIGLVWTIPLALAASAAGGFGNGLVNVAQNALIAGHTPADQRGQTFSAAGATMQAAIGAGTAAGAPLVSGLGAGHAMAAAGALAAMAALTGLVGPLAQSARRQTHAPGGLSHPHA